MYPTKCYINAEALKVSIHFIDRFQYANMEQNINKSPTFCALPGAPNAFYICLVCRQRFGNIDKIREHCSIIHKGVTVYETHDRNCQHI